MKFDVIIVKDLNKIYIFSNSLIKNVKVSIFEIVENKDILLYDSVTDFTYRPTWYAPGKTLNKINTVKVLITHDEKVIFEYIKNLNNQTNNDKKY